MGCGSSKEKGAAREGGNPHHQRRPPRQQNQQDNRASSPRYLHRSSRATTSPPSTTKHTMVAGSTEEEGAGSSHSSHTNSGHGRRNAAVPRGRRGYLRPPVDRAAQNGNGDLTVNIPYSPTVPRAPTCSSSCVVDRKPAFPAAPGVQDDDHSSYFVLFSPSGQQSSCEGSEEAAVVEQRPHVPLSQAAAVEQRTPISPIEKVLDAEAVRYSRRRRR